MMKELIEREAAIEAITLGNTVTHLQNNIRALPAAQVTVKPLEFGEIDHGLWSSGASLGGEYRIRLIGGVGYTVSRGMLAIPHRDAVFDTLDLAKAAAQADYAARVRAALDVAPVSLAEAARVSEIAELIAVWKKVETVGGIHAAPRDVWSDLVAALRALAGEPK